jgi:hypothetical protein
MMVNWCADHGIIRIHRGQNGQVGRMFPARKSNITSVIFREFYMILNYRPLPSHFLTSVYHSRESEPQKKLALSKFHSIRCFLHGNSELGPSFMNVKLSKKCDLSIGQHDNHCPLPGLANCRHSEAKVTDSRLQYKYDLEADQQDQSSR